MDVTELLKSSVQAIRTNKIRSLLTTLGIVIGVASVILLVSIGSGLQAFVTSQFEQLGANLVFVLPGKIKSFAGPGALGMTPKFTFEDVRNLERIGDPIKLVSAAMTKSGTMKYKNKTYDTVVIGADENHAVVRNLSADFGSFITKSMVERSQMVTVIGPKVATNLFGSPEQALGKTVDILDKKVVVVGVTEAVGGGFGGTDDHDSMSYLPITAMIKITGNRKPAAIYVMATTAEKTAQATEKIKNYFYRRKLTDDDFTVMEPKELLTQINAFLGAVTAALSGIAAISLVVGGIGIANIMLVSVTERTREIGLRKAIGATNRDILAQFLIESIILSALGGAIGIGIGWGFSMLLAQFIQTEVTFQAIGMAFGISALVGIVSGFAPAWRASRLDPITALRYE